MSKSIKDNLRKWLKVSQMQAGMRIAVPKAQAVSAYGGCLGDDSVLEEGPGDIMWDEIAEIKKVGQEKVYDIEVEGTHNFVAGNMIDKEKGAKKAWFGGIFAHNTYISSRLGIGGDTTPDAILEIVSDGTNPMFAISNSTGGDGDLFIVDSSGNVGIGTTTVDGPLDIVGLASSTGTPISIDGNDSLVKETSLQIYKEDVEELSFGLETLMQLQPREFNWIDEKGGFHDFGFIAEEINAVNPLLAQYDHGNLQGVKYSKMTALLTKAMQELVVEVRGLGGFGGEVDILGVTTGSTEPIFENNTSIDILGTTTESNEPVLTLNENGIIAQLQFDDIEMDTNLLSTLTKKIKATLEWLGMRLEDGVAYVREIVTDKLTAETVRIKRMEIVDSVTGEIYCTWIENGDWKKELGDCDSAIGEYVSESEPESEPESPPILETTTPSDEPPLEILDTTTPTE